MKIFISYAFEDRDIADRISLSLIKHHKVFFDHLELKGGYDYNDKIRQEIKNCDLFIFLISPYSITRASYTLTEIAFAREKWSHPEGHVLPVMICETSYDSIPPYISAVTILEPVGNVVAEVSARVNNWQQDNHAPDSITLANKTLRIFLKGRSILLDTKLDVLWDGKVVGKGSVRHGFDVTINNVSDEPHTVSVKFKEFYPKIYKDLVCAIDPMKMASQTIELVCKYMPGNGSWKYVK